MNNYEDDLPFENGEYDSDRQEDYENKILNIINLLNKMKNQSKETNYFLETLESYIKFKLNLIECKTDFKQMEELVEYLAEQFFIPVYGNWDIVQNKYVTKIANVIKEHIKNGVVREIEIFKSEDGKINLEIRGFGDYNKVISEKDLGNNGSVIYFKVRK